MDDWNEKSQAVKKRSTRKNTDQRRRFIRNNEEFHDFCPFNEQHGTIYVDPYVLRRHDF